MLRRKLDEKKTKLDEEIFSDFPHRSMWVFDNVLVEFPFTTRNIDI